MYFEHFGLDSQPFRFTPATNELYLGASHREALAALEWGLLFEPTGFTLLAGETGTGKTTLLYHALQRHSSYVKIVSVTNPTLKIDEILRLILSQLGVEASGLEKLDLLNSLEACLQRLEPRERVAVVIDEAQDLTDQQLEELRLLSNYGCKSEKQLHFLLVGQPELLQRLERRWLRQLNQRVGARVKLEPLERREAFAYVDHLLRASGKSAKLVFDRRALNHLLRHSGGIPRRINVLGHNSMVEAYASGSPRVTMRIARAVAAEHEIKSREAARARIAPKAIARCLHLGEALVGGFVLGMVALHSMRGPDTVSQAPSVTAGPAEQADAMRVATPLEASAKDLRQDWLLARQPIRPRRSVSAEPGDTLQNIAVRYLGSDTALSSLIRANPQLADINRIDVGENIYLPDADSSADFRRPQ